MQENFRQNSSPPRALTCPRLLYHFVSYTEEVLAPAGTIQKTINEYWLIQQGRRIF